MPSPLDYSSFADAFHQHFSSNPNRRAQLGINRDLGELPDPSLAAAEARVRRSKELIDACAAIPREALDFDQKLDLDLADLTLRAESARDQLSWGG
ncbi:MAG: hypothetical protein KC492_32980, partial [Myxococcales bacterium]|nr:hypothetical protein [Myxococcales bacterium]